MTEPRVQMGFKAHPILRERLRAFAERNELTINSAAVIALGTGLEELERLEAEHADPGVAGRVHDDGAGVPDEAVLDEPPGGDPLRDSGDGTSDALSGAGSENDGRLASETGDHAGGDVDRGGPTTVGEDVGLVDISPWEAARLRLAEIEAEIADDPVAALHAEMTGPDLSPVEQTIVVPEEPVIDSDIGCTHPSDDVVVMPGYAYCGVCKSVLARSA